MCTNFLPDRCGPACRAAADPPAHTRHRRHRRSHRAGCERQGDGPSAAQLHIAPAPRWAHRRDRQRRRVRPGHRVFPGRRHRRPTISVRSGAMTRCPHRGTPDEPGALSREVAATCRKHRVGGGHRRGIHGCRHRRIRGPRRLFRADPRAPGVHFGISGPAGESHSAARLNAARSTTTSGTRHWRRSVHQRAGRCDRRRSGHRSCTGRP